MVREKSQWEIDYEKRQALINGYARQFCQPRVTVVEKIIVYHPDEYLRYLRQNPCHGCVAESFCDSPCRAYLHWYNARMEAARARVRR